jgi:PAS domain S-box-containing protein
VQDLVIVDEALTRLIGATDEQQVHDTVADAVHRLLPGGMVIVSSLSADGVTMRAAAWAGLEDVRGGVTRLLGEDALQFSYSLANQTEQQLSPFRTGRIEPVAGLHDLSLGRIPKPIARAIEAVARIGRIYAIGFSWDGLHYGCISLALPKGVELPESDAITLLAHQATIAIRRLRAEQELRESRAELDAFFSESLDLLAVAGMDGCFKRLNPRWVETLGFSVETLTSSPFLEFVHPDDVEQTKAAVGRLMAGHTETRFVNRYRTSSGEYRWLEWRAFPRRGLIYAAARDLTERIEAEQAVRASEERYRLMADNTADVIWILDVSTMRFTYVSPSAERLRGYTAEEVLEQSMDEVMTPESLERIGETLPRMIAAAQSGDESAWINIEEVDQPRRDGSIVATEVTTTFLTDAEGNIDRVLGVSRDITERRQAEAEIRALNESLEARVRERTAQLEEAIAELEAFSYSVSHDLRAPLRAINGYATILVEDHGADIGEDGRRSCDSIIGNTRRMGQLIDDLLAFSRLGRSRLAREPIDMAVLAQAALGDVTTDLQRGRVTLSVGDLPPVTGDPTLLRQVWSNLLSNALKFTSEETCPTIVVAGAREDGEAVFSVRDNGPGFDMRHASKLFQVFERLHGAEYEGSGVGLAIARRAVEAHGGRIWAEGEPGKGATFFFALPAAGPPEERPAS